MIGKAWRRAAGWQSCRGAVLQGAIVKQQCASCPHLSFCPARDDIKAPGAARGAEVATGVSVGQDKAKDSLSSRRSGILLGCGQQICFQGIVEERKTREGSELPQSCSCPGWDAEGGGDPTPAISLPHSSAFIPSTAAALLSSPLLCGLAVGIVHSLALTRCSWLCCSSSVARLSWRCLSPREMLHRVNVLPAPGGYSPLFPLLLSHSQAQLQTRL